MAIAPGDARVEDAAGFLRRLSVADAKVLLERTRREKENKTMEMQKMIGVRYRDLIESADKIVNMHSAALRLEVSLKEMPEQWKRVEAVVKDALTASNDASIAAELEPTREISRNGGQAPHSVEASDEAAALFVQAPEQIWALLDCGEVFQAFLFFQRAKNVFEKLDLDAAEHRFPFIRAQWSSVESFETRLTEYARSYLACRGRESCFYAENLCGLAATDTSLASPKALLNCLLQGRSKWMNGDEFEDNGRDASPAQVLARHQRTLSLFLRTVCMTMLHLEEIFKPQDGETLLQPLFQVLPRFEEDLKTLVTSGEFERVVAKWFQKELSKVQAIAMPIISQIVTIALLSRVQAHLTKIDKSYDGCRHVNVWVALAQETGSKGKAQPDSVFTVLFADAFRKRTRDLVQNSFIDAFEAIKTQIRSAVGASCDPSCRNDLRLSSIAFYDYFERIQDNTSALDASDLQSVLMEEFMRTLFKLVVFLEKDFPLSHDHHQNHASDSADRSIIFLAISNILAGVLAGFPVRRGKLFPVTDSEVTTPGPDEDNLRTLFDKYSSKGLLHGTAMTQLVQELYADSSTSGHFIDEDMKAADAVGFHSCYLVAELRSNVSYPLIFERVLHKLSTAYCEEWAQILLGQKIQPLRELLEMENYNATNEEWINTHEGWTEHVITDDVLGGDDTDDSSDAGMQLGEEKVWLPWCETPVVSSFLFSCCYGLDEANRVVQRSCGSDERQVSLMHWTIRDVLVEQLTLATTKAYDDAVSLLIAAKATNDATLLNFGEYCVLQFLFDMYFVRATLGFSDFIRFGWGDELNPEECSPGLLQLKKLFARMQEFIDPVDWEIYGPQLVENVVLQFRKSRLLFSSLSESNDINEINGKEIIVSAQDTRPLARIMEPVARFSLLPVPSSRRKFHRSTSSMSRSSEDELPEPRSRANSRNLFHELSEDGDAESQQPSALRFQNLLSGSAGSNLFSAAASTNLLSSAAKGIGFLSSAIREGENRSSKYF